MPFHQLQPFPAANQTNRSLSLFPLLGRFLYRSLLRRRLYRLHSDASNGAPTDAADADWERFVRFGVGNRRGDSIIRKLVFRSAHAMPTTAAMAEVLRGRQLQRLAKVDAPGCVNAAGRSGKQQQ